jgi:hypothetical protein
VHRTTLRTLPLAAACVLAVPAGAAAQDLPTTAAVAGGQTTLRLDPGTAGALTGAGVRLTPTGAARVRGGGVRFPVSGGSADPGTLAGRVTHRGGLRLRAGGRSVVLRAPVYRIGERSTLSARVGGARLTVAVLGTDDARLHERGPVRTGVGGVTATLTAPAARALNRAFGVSLFRRGLALGTVGSELRFRQVVLDGGATGLALDPAAAQALTALGVAPGVVAPATLEAGEVRFPITAGRVDARTLAGQIAHSGALSLTGGGTPVELRDPLITVDETPALSAVVGTDRLEVLTLDASAARRSIDGNVVTVGGVVARLTGPAAAALNAAFGTTALTEGLVLGTATIRGTAR